MKVIILYKKSSEVVVVHPSYKNKKEDESEIVYLTRVLKRARNNDPSLDGLDYEFINASDLPDRKFRGQWRGSIGQKIRIEK